MTNLNSINNHGKVVANYESKKEIEDNTVSLFSIYFFIL